MQLFKCYTIWNSPDELNFSVWKSQEPMIQFLIGNNFILKHGKYYLRNFTAMQLGTVSLWNLLQCTGSHVELGRLRDSLFKLIFWWKLKKKSYILNLLCIKTACKILYYLGPTYLYQKFEGLESSWYFSLWPPNTMIYEISH